MVQYNAVLDFCEKRLELCLVLHYVVSTLFRHVELHRYACQLPSTFHQITLLCLSPISNTTIFLSFEQ